MNSSLWGKYHLGYVGLVTIALAFAVGCSNAGITKDQAMKQCFTLVEGEVTSTIIFEGNEKAATLTVLERRHGTQVAEPASFPGRIEDGAFIQADGFRTELDKQEVSWPDDSLLAGLTFKRSPCP